MPKEKFYDQHSVEGDGSLPHLVVIWGIDLPQVKVNDVVYDRSGLNRLIKTLRKARNQTFGMDE